MAVGAGATEVQSDSCSWGVRQVMRGMRLPAGDCLVVLNSGGLSRTERPQVGRFIEAGPHALHLTRHEIDRLQVSFKVNNYTRRFQQMHSPADQHYTIHEFALLN